MSFEIQIPRGWTEQLEQELHQPYMHQLREKLAIEYAEETVYPSQDHIFRALELTPYDAVKVVILGQDPYHGAGQAHGLSFSVQPGVKLPPSLKNIYKELQEDIGCEAPNHGFLEHWARQGVLLLNSVLTVREAAPNSHRKYGWGKLTDRIITTLNERERPIVFILWGRHAQDKGQYIDTARHLVMNFPHPSPLSAYAGFFGSRPFSQTNTFLNQNGVEEIDWHIPAII
ncbi:MAG: uracil-DNA glycosylase [Candidatus Cohnella colombiensis]|uniref:Uracil-DNA glycosylase n=1 Tax=Candidatus Cohnella colombiensis TaxID=3121368 RepID=A0AA95ETU9_9BACL|nr:MAG: uracil-DNA glycosylase [Cohnella sp.]